MEYCDRVQSMALKTRPAIPLIYGIDSLHGSNKTMNAVIFPHHIGLGAANNPALVEKIARITAFESRASDSAGRFLRAWLFLLMKDGEEHTRASARTEV